MRNRRVTQLIEEELGLLRTEYDEVDSTTAYLGKAVAGSATSDAVWQIARFTYGASDDDVSKEFAGGSPGRVHVWDDRASLSYS